MFSLTSFGQGERPDDIVNYTSVAEPRPTYPGGIDSLRTFIEKNLKYAKGTVDHAGVVYVQFIVTEDGSTTDFKVLKGLCSVCDKNAIETLKKMPKWIPPIVNNKPTRTRMILPVKYEL